jgi:hypothetical protein
MFLCLRLYIFFMVNNEIIFITRNEYDKMVDCKGRLVFFKASDFLLSELVFLLLFRLYASMFFLFLKVYKMTVKIHIYFVNYQK